MQFKSLVVQACSDVDLDEDERWYTQHHIPEGCQEMLVQIEPDRVALIATEDGRAIFLDMEHEATGSLVDLVDANMPFSAKRGREDGTVVLTIRIDDDEDA